MPPRPWSLWRRFAHPLSSGPSWPFKSSRRSRVRLTLEPLEDRILLSGDPPADDPWQQAMDELNAALTANSETYNNALAGADAAYQLAQQQSWDGYAATAQALGDGFLAQSRGFAVTLRDTLDDIATSHNAAAAASDEAITGAWTAALGAFQALGDQAGAAFEALVASSSATVSQTASAVQLRLEALLAADARALQDAIDRASADFEALRAAAQQALEQAADDAQVDYQAAADAAQQRYDQAT